MPHDYSRHLVLAEPRRNGTETRGHGDREDACRRRKSKIKDQKSKMENGNAQERPQGNPPAQRLYSNAYLGDALGVAALGEGVGVAGPLEIGVP